MRQALFTKIIQDKLQKQYPLGADMTEQKVIVRFFHPLSGHKWFIMNQDPDDRDYLWAIVTDGQNVEAGSVSKIEIESLRLRGLPVERDISFKETNAKEIWDSLQKGEYLAKGGDIVYKRVKFIGDATTYYYVIDEDADNYTVVIEEKIDLWKSGDKLTKADLYEETIPKSEFSDEFAEGGEMLNIKKTDKRKE